MMDKLLVITSCNDCIFCVCAIGRVEWCEWERKPTEREDYQFPDWCPLPDAEQPEE